MKYLKNFAFVAGLFLVNYAAAESLSAQRYHEMQGEGEACKKNAPFLPEGACVVGFFGAREDGGKFNPNKLSDDPKSAIFYRAWLSRSDAGKGVFQDFHVSGARRTNPFVALLGKDIFIEGNLVSLGVDGQLDGGVVVWRENQNKAMSIEFGKGGVQGKRRLWYSNGQIQENTEYNANVINGKSERWYESGRRKYVSYSQFGVEEGGVTSWFDNGSKSIEGSYDNGLMQGRWSKWYPNGQMGESRHYDNSVRVGEWKWWYPNGQLKTAGSYEAGKPKGVWTNWFESGAKAAEFEYQNGVLMNKKLWAEDGSIVESK